MKKLFCILTCVCVTLALCAMTASAKTLTGKCGENVTYTLDTESGVLSISGEGDMHHYGMEGAPWTDYRDDIRKAVINKGVTSIGSCAFHMCKNLSEVTIPNSVTYIGAWVFTCTAIKRITIPEGVTSIGLNTFRSCEKLNSISLPDTLSYIGNHAFFDCKALTSITIPDGVTTIKADTFFRCTSLKRVSLPQSLITIEAEAFSRCHSLKSINIPNKVTTIKNLAFSECSSLEEITIPASVKKIGYDVFDGCSDELIINYEGGYIKPTNMPVVINENDDSGEQPDLTPNVTKGDVDGNGKVDKMDVTVSITAIASNFANDNADMDGDGKVTLIDVLRVLKAVTE